MFDRMSARHEAGHAIVAAALGMGHVAIVRADGSGLTRFFDNAQFDNLAPSDAALLAVAGSVAETVVLDGNLKRAVSDVLSAEGDGDMLRTALRALGGGENTVMAVVMSARSILLQHRAEFDRLTTALECDGIGQARLGGSGVAPERKGAPVARLGGSGVAPERKGAPVAGLTELRAIVAQAHGNGNTALAALLNATIARREGRPTARVVEIWRGAP